MNISTINSTNSTDISPFVVMAQLRRLRRSDPIRFKAVLASISSAVFSEDTTLPHAAEAVGKTSETDRTFLMATRSRRWPVATFGGMALVGAVTLILLRPNEHVVAHLVTAGGNTAVARTIVPVREEAVKKTEPRVAVAASKTTAGPLTELAPFAGTLPIPKRLFPTTTSQTTEDAKRSQHGTRRTTLSPATKDWSPEERWLAH